MRLASACTSTVRDADCRAESAEADVDGRAAGRPPRGERASEHAGLGLRPQADRPSPSIDAAIGARARDRTRTVTSPCSSGRSSGGATLMSIGGGAASARPASVACQKRSNAPLSAARKRHASIAPETSRRPLPRGIETIDRRPSSPAVAGRHRRQPARRGAGGAAQQQELGRLERRGTGSHRQLRRPLEQPFGRCQSAADREPAPRRPAHPERAPRRRPARA